MNLALLVTLLLLGLINADHADHDHDHDHDHNHDHEHEHEPELVTDVKKTESKKKFGLQPGQVRFYTLYIIY